MSIDTASIISFSSLVGWLFVKLLSDMVYCSFDNGLVIKSLKNQSVSTGHCAFLKSNVTLGFPILCSRHANISNQGKDISHRFTRGTGSPYLLAQASLSASCS